jgi:hypothetical protein
MRGSAVQDHGWFFGAYDSAHDAGEAVGGIGFKQFMPAQDNPVGSVLAVNLQVNITIASKHYRNQLLPERICQLPAFAQQLQDNFARLPRCSIFFQLHPHKYALVFCQFFWRSLLALNTQGFEPAHIHAGAAQSAELIYLQQAVFDPQSAKRAIADTNFTGGTPFMVDD